MAKDKSEKHAAEEVLMPVRDLPVMFHADKGKDWPGVVLFVYPTSLDVEVTKPTGVTFVQRLPLTPGEKSAKGYSWSHA